MERGSFFLSDEKKNKKKKKKINKLTRNKQ